MNATYRGSYIAGQFQKPSKGFTWTHKNPFDLSKIACEWIDGVAHIDNALQASSQAFPLWKATDLQKRIQLVLHFKQELLKRRQAIEDCIVFETGKARWEAAQEADALGNKIDISIQTMIPLMASIAEQIKTTGSSEMQWVPRGVCLVLGPFNFPLHLANGHIVPALLTGNTVIFKPSEAGVAAATLYTEALDAAGFPPGVFQMIPGNAETGQKLVEDVRVQGVFFTGSYANGRRIVESLLRSRGDLGTIAALEMGGKNASIIHEDASLEKAVSEVVVSAYATAGQRCSSTSRLLVHENLMSAVLEKLQTWIQKIPTGDPSDPKTFMGPLIHEKAKDGYLQSLERARLDKVEVLIESRSLKDQSCLVSPSLYVLSNPKDKWAFKEEFFGPNLIVSSYKSFEELFELHEATPYGLVASVFTESPEFFSLCRDRFNVGLINHNRGTVGASSKLPFGGTKKSGNHWPAGIFSFLYCASPQSQLLESGNFDPQKLPRPLQPLVST